MERRPRPAAVTTNVKALFDGPGPHNGGAAQFRPIDDSLGFAGPMSYHEPHRVQEYWRPAGLQSNNSRAESEASKRDSDPVIQDKVRQASANHPQSHAARAISARTQSLDITSLNLSRALAGSSQSAFGPMPPSPGAATSSPNTATAQFFPGQHGLRANVTGRGMGNYDNQMETVTQGA